MYDLLLKIAQTGGPVGICLVLMYLFARQQDKTVREVEAKRVADAQAMTQKLLDLNDKWNETINSQIEVQEAQKNLLSDVRRAIDDQIRYGRRA